MPSQPVRFLQPCPTQPDLPLFVFFPGMDGTGKLFSRQIDGLSQRFDLRCLAIAGNDRHDWTGLVARSLQLITTELGEKRQLFICGESFGACLAMQVAGQLKDKINQLILINPASSLGRFPLLANGFALSNLVPPVMYPLSARILVNFLIAAERVASRDYDSLVDAILSVPPQTAMWRLSLLRQFPVNSIVSEIVDVPALLIAGELDRLLPSRLEVRILQTSLRKSKTLLLPHSGHACLLEKGISLVDLLSD
jgi:pimeloyl-ACP methyl ester carboxylesterase